MRRRGNPTESSFFLVPFDETNLAEYREFPSINDLMQVNSCGVKTHRDGFVIDFDKRTLVARMSDVASEKRLQVLRDRYHVHDTPNWKLKDAQAKIGGDEVSQFIKPITYRPFDNRWIYYNPAIIEKGDSKFPTLRHLLAEKSDNLALLTARIQATGNFDAVFVSKYIAEMKTAESSRSSTVYPLFLTEGPQFELTTGARRPNFDPKILKSLADKLGLRSVGEFGLPRELLPEDIFGYIYAIFHCPSYRRRYAPFLKIDYPRVPFTGNLILFRVLARLGKELVALHLLDSLQLRDIPNTYVGPKNPQVGRIGWSANTVWLDAPASRRGQPLIPGTVGFYNVPEAVWNFHIGGYQVCEKWLKDRRGRMLSKDDIAHYQKMVVALSETIRLMKEIDDVIEKHAGWPGAFAQGDVTTQAVPMETEHAGNVMPLVHPKSMAPKYQIISSQLLSAAEPVLAPYETVTLAERESTHPNPDELDREDLICRIRQLFGDGQERERETAIDALARELGYHRTGSRIHDELDNALRTAVRRGILASELGTVCLFARTIEQYDRDFLKEQFLASLDGRRWIEREDAVRAFARWMGFRRTGPAIEDAARSLMNGLLREDRLEGDGPRIRRSG
jgi:hypothetical protein